jgi:hypothetical protein
MTALLRLAILTSGIPIAGCRSVPGHVGSTIHALPQESSVDEATACREHCRGADACRMAVRADVAGEPKALVCISTDAPAVAASPLIRVPAGRISAGTTLDDVDEPSTEGALLAQMAAMELASVVAFSRFVTELRALGAPRCFVERARTAIRDERRHARALARLAAARSGSARAIRTATTAVRDPLEVALENAVEGCVRETASALVAHHLALASPSEPVRAAFTKIAPDEAEHAALAWGVHRWLLSKLHRRDVARVQRALNEAIADVVEHAGCATQAEESLGIPSRTSARIMTRALFQSAGEWLASHEHAS